MCYKQKCNVVSLNLAHPVDEVDINFEQAEYYFSFVEIKELYYY